jgi:hypothetical protein
MKNEPMSAKRSAPGRLLHSVLLFYLGAVALWLIVFSLGFAPQMLASKKAAAWAFVPLFSLLAIIGHVTGEAPCRGGPVNRIREPVWFWIVVSFYWVCALGMLGAALFFTLDSGS